jgi:predicted NAD-dependent protein-ADP-ribosyltransferase YbiA (DUF1768 family)
LTLKYGDQAVIERKIEQDAIMMFKRRREETIDGFCGYFEYLKPEYPAKVMYEGEVYNSVAHAYAAAKTEKGSLIRKRILKAPTYKDMLEISATVEQPPEFLHRRHELMVKLQTDKFRRNKELRERFKTTDQKVLINSFNASNLS